MAIVLKVNSVDKTDQIDWQSLSKLEVLTKEPDILQFSVKNYGSKTFRPELGDDVKLYEDGDIIFGGVVVDTRERVDSLLKFFDVVCKDYTHTLDRELVVRSYEGQTANAIIADILSTFVEAGYTGTNVDAPVVVQYISFNYLPVSQALQKLAEMLGGYDWYVDYEKDIHFFKPADVSAPFNLTDDGGTYIWNSLKVKENTQQLRNHIIIRGGEVEGDQVQNVQVADGVQRVFFVGYNLHDFVAEKALAATPSTFVTLTVGNDGVDDPADYDTLYNPDRGLLTFPDGSKPATNDRVRTTGLPVFPLIAEKEDVVSVALYGKYEYLIVDKTILTRAAASQRASAELEKYGRPIHQANFVTYTSGLRTGQTINIQSTIRDIDQDYKIERITTKLRTPSSLYFEVSCLASENVTMVDIFNKLLIKNVSDQIEIGANEVLDLLYSATEEINIGEAVVVSTSHNPQTETISFGEVATVQAIDFAVIFCAGAQVPDGFKRQFIIEGSRLG